jgi:GNAT superfamily N-acetyltransferase
VSDSRCQIRPADAGDADAVADLAAELAQSFPLSRTSFHLSYQALLAADDAVLLLAVDGQERLGYLLGFQHLTFYANGPVAWVEDVAVHSPYRGRGIGRDLMRAFEQWAGRQGCAVIALATRRAAPFYRALGYEESAVYFRKVLDNQTTEQPGPRQIRAFATPTVGTLSGTLFSSHTQQVPEQSQVGRVSESEPIKLPLFEPVDGVKLLWLQVRDKASPTARDPHGQVQAGLGIDPVQDRPAIKALELSPQLLGHLSPERIFGALTGPDVTAREVPYIWIPPPPR